MKTKLQEKVSLLPLKSGVYIMKNKDGEVIYVGKAKKLKNRVKSYFDNSSKTVKTYALVSNIEDFDYIITESELDAFALESNLIKKYKPKYNIMLKDDKSFPYIKIDLKERFPRVTVVRRPKKDGSLLFGPYVTGLRISEIMRIIKWAYPIRWCNTSFESNKTKARVCLHGEIGNCIAPCVDFSKEQEYLSYIHKIIDFLNGDNKDVKVRLQERMNNFANSMQFEEALEVRNMLYSIDLLDAQLIASLTNQSNIDVFAIASSDECKVINVMKIRGGKNVGQFNYHVDDAVGEDSELVSSFICSYYQKEEFPKEIIVDDYMSSSSEVLSQYLANVSSKKIKITIPIKGIKKQLLNNAFENAKEYAFNSRDRIERHKRLTTDALKELADICKLDNIFRIEGYDISNISGTNNVASMVVFEDGEPAKKEYRKFKIKTVEGADDFASMKETLQRRITSLVEKQTNFDKRPDLIVIDGGLGQLHKAYEAIKEAGEDIPVISLAKKDEEIYTVLSNVPIRLEKNNYALRLLERVRDEAHRFAVLYHRNLRRKSLKSVLFEIEGVGKVLSARIWKKFKTKENIFSASPSELAEVEGISQKKALQIYNNIHEGH